MKKYILLLLFIYTTIVINAQDGIKLIQGNKAYYRLNVSGDRSHTDVGVFNITCDNGMQEIRFLDKDNNRLNTINTNGKVGNFEYNTGDYQFTKHQFPIKVHIDNDFVDRFLCKGWAIYDFPDSWWTNEFRDRGMDVIKVEYKGSCDSKRYSGFWQPDDGYYGDTFYFHAAYVYMRNLRVKSDPVIELKTPTSPLYLASEEYITVSVPDNLLDNRNDYSYYWKFKVGSESNYRSISSRFVTVEKGNKVLHIRGNEFLEPSDYGKRVRLVLDAGCQDSNAISFTYYPSAPKVTAVEKTDPICYQGDGKVKINFSRNLNSTLKEKLTINLKDNLGIRYTSSILTTFKTEPNNTYSYTFEGVKAGEYQIEFAGGNLTFNGTILSTIVRDPEAPVIIEDPLQVLFDVSVRDANCNDGDGVIDNNNDGSITINAEGGRNGVYQFSIKEIGDNSGLNWQEFDNVDQHMEGDLRPGTYEIKVRKKIGYTYCIGHYKNDIANTIITKIITEPDQPLNVEQVYYKEPTAYGFNDGKISYIIKGGTPYTDGTYTYQFKNSTGVIQNTVTIEVLDNKEGFVLTLHSVGADIYSLWISDKNYNEAIYQTGCYEDNISVNLRQPDPIEVVFEVINPISCNIYNKFSDGRDFETPYGIADQFQDGQIVAHVSGGLRFNTENKVPLSSDVPVNANGSGLPYYYNWKKKVNNVWTDIAINDSIIKYQSYGEYALNIKDKNGIILGNYSPFVNSEGEIEYMLVTPINSTFYLSQPQKLSISFEKTDITCFNGADATATATVNGGIPPYEYYWSNGATTATASNLFAGRHIIYVTDAKGCVIEGSVTIEQPNSLVINPVQVVAPTCFQGNDGYIEVEVTGGEPPYTYVWSNGVTNNVNRDLTADTYSLEIIDNQGCRAFYETTIENPALIALDLPDEYTICQGQSLALDITIDDSQASYKWSSDIGFSSNAKKVQLDQSGVYTVKITNRFGCSNEDTIKVNFLDKGIDAHYLIATQAYVGEEVTLINISDPVGDNVEWTVPNNIKIIKENFEELTVVFEKEGVYDINLRSYVESCYMDFNKKIIVQSAVETYNPSNKDQFIKEFIMYPNPNTGTFQTKITLEESSDITVKIIHITSGAVLDQKHEVNNVEFLLDNSVSLASGLYLVVLETSRGVSQRKLVIE
ncbi:T9SS type A sorting domain-containing protein [Aquimarina sp. W85]|uniref:T9SS type A sorting domain-containing protein n=1 Tax=Aquimarina rhodophyticola TaxID=3342246 RepID=UPI00366BF08E